MMHGPCGTDRPNAPCMNEGACSKHYPRAFQQTTVQSANGYPLYRRREFIDGVSRVAPANAQGVELDNRSVRCHSPSHCDTLSLSLSIQTAGADTGRDTYY